MKCPSRNGSSPSPAASSSGSSATVALLFVGDLSAYKLGVFGVGYDAINFVLSGSFVPGRLSAPSYSSSSSPPQ